MVAICPRHANRSMVRRMYRPQSISEFSGFTFLELIIVIAIVGLMAVLAVPWFLKISQRNIIKSAAYEIQTTLLAARMAAVRRNGPVTVAVTPAAGADSVHSFATIEPPPPLPTPVPLPRRLQIPKRNFDFITVPTGNTITFAGDGNMTSFPPPTPALIVIRGPAGSGSPNQITIETSWRGAVKVITPTAWQ